MNSAFSEHELVAVDIGVAVDRIVGNYATKRSNYRKLARNLSASGSEEFIKFHDGYRFFPAPLASVTSLPFSTASMNTNGSPRTNDDELGKRIE